MFIAFEELRDEETLLVNIAHIVTASAERRKDAPVLLRLTFLGEKPTETTLYFGPDGMTDLELKKRKAQLRAMLNGNESHEAWTKKADAAVREFIVELH